MATHEETRRSATANESPNRSANNSELSANETANKPEPFGVAFGERAVQQWRSVQQIAEVEGVGERAIQKRCQRGYYVARLTEGEKGEVWEIDANSIKSRANATANRRTNEGELSANRSANDDEPFGEREGSNARIIPFAVSEISKTSDPDALNYEVELLRVQLDSARAEATREREFSKLLKSQLEAVTQSEAQTKAALREALKAMPKALPVATDAHTTTAAPPEASDAPQIASANNVPTATSNTVKSPANREDRPLWKVMFGIR